jgi:threonine dehydrogenase-like Zn-dependent dehydrogenase
MCRNGQYTERGIKARDGYASDRFRIDPEYAVSVDSSLDTLGVLLEPASVVAKAWDHIDRIGHRTRSWAPRVVLVTGAGPIGLLAALMAQQRGCDVHVYDRLTDGAKPRLTADLGATYHAGSMAALGDLAPDVVIECTGATPVIVDVLSRSGASGIVCLAGVSSGRHAVNLDVSGLNRQMVLENDVLFGSVNANRTHYQQAAAALARADRRWLSGLITRRVPLGEWRSALDPSPDDIKVVIDFGGDR